MSTAPVSARTSRALSANVNAAACAANAAPADAPMDRILAPVAPEHRATVRAYADALCDETLAAGGSLTWYRALAQAVAAYLDAKAEAEAEAEASEAAGVLRVIDAADAIEREATAGLSAALAECSASLQAILDAREAALASL